MAAWDGIANLGGDDFDELLAALALAAAGLDEGNLTQAERHRLLEECREKKEALHPNTRRIVADLERVHEGLPQVTVPVALFYEQCEPLVEETLQATSALLESPAAAGPVSLYVTGGASELPLVGRLLRERFGRRVRRSAYTRAATAIGLAIQAEERSAYRLRERFTRWFGVWREAECGTRILFDPLFERGEELPAPGEPPLVRRRSYCPMHNIGHFRYLECSQRGAAGDPAGDFTQWDEIRFPFDPALADAGDLTPHPVVHTPAASLQTIEETYAADSSGAIEVTIANLSAGYRRSFRLGRWSAAQPATLAPAKKRRTATR